MTESFRAWTEVDFLVVKDAMLWVGLCGGKVVDHRYSTMYVVVFRTEICVDQSARSAGCLYLESRRNMASLYILRAPRSATSLLLVASFCSASKQLQLDGSQTETV